MFAVRGWSVSGEKLKIEAPIDNGKETTSTEAPTPPKNRKRKRSSHPQNSQTVTASNLSDMWEKVIEHKQPCYSDKKLQSGKEKGQGKKEKQRAGPSRPDRPGKDQGTESKGKQGQQDEAEGNKPANKNKNKKNSDPSTEDHAADDHDDEWAGFDDNNDNTEPRDSKAPAEIEDKETPRKNKKQKRNTENKYQPDGKSPRQPVTTTKAPPAPPATVKLTVLQASMRDKLISARFRHLNETLYTKPSGESFQLFQESPEMFTEYHEGFRRQVDVWPENPVDGYIADIEARAKVRFPPKDARHDFANPISSIRLLPLPRDHRGEYNLCRIADLGCGDAALAARLKPKLRKHRLDIRSFDLQTADSPLITRADIANLPLADSSVDVAIFCLALMGTNWLDFIEEAYRVLRWKGELWVAEIKSRFTNPAAKQNNVVAHSVGNRKNPAVAGGRLPNSKKSREDAQAVAAEEDAELAVAVDGVELRQQETDITAFVDALRARGFLLQRELGGGAVDMGNKMFVKMHFVKSAPATKGKYADDTKNKPDRMGHQGPVKKKFITDDESPAGNEAAILKPCVYKLR